MKRYWLALPLVGALGAGAVLYEQRGGAGPAADTGKAGEKPADLKPAVSLPISQVILFNSGVGHFTRSGEVELQAKLKSLHGDEAAARKSYDNYLANLSAE